VLLHVVDISSRYALQQSKVVEETLGQLGCLASDDNGPEQDRSNSLQVKKVQPRPMSRVSLGCDPGGGRFGTHGARFGR